MGSGEKSPTEKAMLVALRRGAIRLAPLSIESSKESADLRRGSGIVPDAVLKIRAHRKQFRFVVRCKALRNPKTFFAAIDDSRRIASALGMKPLVLIPYLSPDQIDELESRGVSGLDLCGNGIVVAL